MSAYSEKFHEHVLKMTGRDQDGNPKAPPAPTITDILREVFVSANMAAERLREFGLMLADAIEIADSCARSDIECNLPGDGEGWYDTTATKEDHDAWLAQSLRYLDARGLIERSPDARHIIRFPKVTP